MIQSEDKKNIAVLIPCYNEEKTIGKVIRDIRAALPEANIYVFDNNCTDSTAEKAVANGALVMKEKRQGKGFVVSSMFDTIIADYYIMIDGDDTYPAEAASQMMEILKAGEADMVVANRLQNYNQTDVRTFHSFGNKLVRLLINLSFHAEIQDPMSGFRAFTYEAIAALPFLSTGFEIETEITIQSLFRDIVIKEVDIEYRNRPTGSVSKLNTYKDGISVLLKIFFLLKAYRPLTFFGLICIVFTLFGLLSGWVVIEEFVRTGIVSHIPLAVLTGLLMLGGFLFGITGLIIHTVNYRILEASRISSKLIRHMSVKLLHD